jgi:site-specific DNA-methyltransferase (adenine-specific)/site-specific DNA-methyltransferase (cytosine-N4-specific)
MKIRDRITELRRVPASELLPNPKNWRTHPTAQADALRGVLAEIGFADAVLARETPDGLMLIDGHLRAEVAPDSIVPVLVLDVDEAEADVILATHDPLAAMATVDSSLLSDLLGNVETNNEAIASMLTNLADEAGVGESVEVVEDEVPEPPADPITKAGDLWQLGDHRLLCGDCRDAGDVSRLMAGDEVAVAITSPPYASQRKYDTESGFKIIPPDDYVDWFELVQENIASHLADDGSWFLNIKEHCEGGQRSLYVKDLTLAHVRNWRWLFVDELCWQRVSLPGGFPNRFKNGWEPIFHFCRNPAIKFRPDNVSHDFDSAGMKTCDEVKAAGKHFGFTQDGSNGGPGGVRSKNREGALPANVLTINGVDNGIDHSAMFPTLLPAFFIRAFSDNSDIIFDPFLGSGTTLIAAEQLGRKCYGLEISPAYCDVIVDRWQNLTGKKAKRGK